jgi:hypothetical protein
VGAGAGDGVGVGDAVGVGTGGGAGVPDGAGVGAGVVAAAGSGLGATVGPGVDGTGTSFGMVMPVMLVLAVLPAWSVQVPVAVWLLPSVPTVVVTVARTGPKRLSLQANTTTG